MHFAKRHRYCLVLVETLTAEQASHFWNEFAPAVLAADDFDSSTLLLRGFYHAARDEFEKLYKPRTTAFQTRRACQAELRKQWPNHAFEHETD